MTHDQLVAELRALKGSGAWQKVADAAGIHYFTVARIARGEMPNPGIKTCERIEAGLLVVKGSNHEPAVQSA